MPWKPIATVWIALAVFPTTSVAADRVELRTGDVLSGKVLRMNDHEVSIELESGGIMSFRLSGVRQVRRSFGEGQASVVVFDRDAPVSRSDPERAPLAVEKAPALGGAEPVAADATSGGEVLLGAPIRDARRGFAVCPPKGFVPWPGGESASVPVALRDPGTRATFTVSTRASSDTLDTVKKEAIRSYTDQFRSFHVIRDEKVDVPDGGDAPSGWLVEIETRAGSSTYRQLQVFRKHGPVIVTLTYSSTEEHYARLGGAFLASVGSFRFDEAKVRRTEP